MCTFFIELINELRYCLIGISWFIIFYQAKPFKIDIKIPNSEHFFQIRFQLKIKLKKLKIESTKHGGRL